MTKAEELRQKIYAASKSGNFRGIGIDPLQKWRIGNYNEWIRQGQAQTAAEQFRKPIFYRG